MQQEIRIGKLIKQLRDASGISLTTLSLQTGLSRSYLSRLENDKREPSLYSLSVICRYFGISSFEIMKRVCGLEQDNDCNLIEIKEILIKKDYKFVAINVSFEVKLMLKNFINELEIYVNKEDILHTDEESLLNLIKNIRKEIIILKHKNI